MMRAGVVFVMALLCAACSSSAPKPELWDRWTAFDSSNRHVIDHRVWQGFLQRYVSGSAGAERIRYGRVSAADHRALSDYLARLQRVPVSTYTLREQRAYWINLCNAALVLRVLDHPQAQDLTQLGDSVWSGWFDWFGWFGSDAFAQRTLQVEGQPLSLADIRDRILRPYWRDARSLYALYDARADGPTLAPFAFGGEYLDEQLEQRTRAYVNGPAALHDDDGHLRVSAFYRRYARDFGSDGELLKHLRRYANPRTRQRLADNAAIAGYYEDAAITRAP